MGQRKALLSWLFLCFFIPFMVSGCGTGGGAETPTTPGTPTTTTTADSLSLSASPPTVKSDGSTTSTITVNALNASNALLSDVTVTLSTDTGILGADSVVTNRTTPATVTFYTDQSKINRTATITATSGTVSAQIPIQIVSSTVTLTATGTTLPDDGGSPVTCTITAKDAGNNLVSSAAVTLSQTGGGGSVTITPESVTWTTGVNGTFTATIAGAAAGAVTLTATALGATATKEFTVSPTAATFAIDQQRLNGVVIANGTTTAMKIGNTLEVRVNAPLPVANVTFASTTGLWDGISSVRTVAVVGGKATSTLTTTQAGIANIQVYDPADPDASDTLKVAMTSGAAAAKITLQASPTVVPRSVGTTTGSSTLIATVYDASGYPIGDAPVAFSIVNPTSGGESVSPVVVLTAATTTPELSLGEARASFTSGSLPSTAAGVQIRAAVVGTGVHTGLMPSGNDSAIIIGGVAGSVAFGRAPVIETLDPSTYALPMSVLVSDINGNPVPEGTIVSLSAWPIAWSTGKACNWDLDNTLVTPNKGTFLNEDINENVYLDPGEDGTRTFYGDGTPASAPGTVNGQSTPLNSDGGVVPATVTTDENGVATFKLIYIKQRAIWTLTRIRASTVVQGTETRGEVIFRLPAEAGDTDPCKLGDSPYTF